MISTRFARMGALVSAFVKTVSVVEGERVRDSTWSDSKDASLLRLLERK